MQNGVITFKFDSATLRIGQAVIKAFDDARRLLHIDAVDGSAKIVIGGVEIAARRGQTSMPQDTLNLGPAYRPAATSCYSRPRRAARCYRCGYGLRTLRISPVEAGRLGTLHAIGQQ